MHSPFLRLLPALAALKFVTSTALTVPPGDVPAASLREATDDTLRIGGAASTRDRENPEFAVPYAKDFNAITAHAHKMPANLVVDEGRYNFGHADAVARFAEQHGMRS